MSFSTFLVNGCLAGLLSQTPAMDCPAVTAPCQCTVPCTTGDPGQFQPLAGWPQTVAWWAIPSDSGGYTVNRVGGGCPVPRVGDAPTCEEGTWGWDYVGQWLRHNVLLGWWHERLCQGGTGAYRTDGPTFGSR